jgi:hypothetical protein
VEILTNHDPRSPSSVIGIWADGEQEDELGRKEDAGDVEQHRIDCDMREARQLYRVKGEERNGLTWKCLPTPFDFAAGECLGKKCLSQSTAIAADR